VLRRRKRDQLNVRVTAPQHAWSLQGHGTRVAALLEHLARRPRRALASHRRRWRVESRGEGRRVGELGRVRPTAQSSAHRAAPAAGRRVCAWAGGRLPQPTAAWALQGAAGGGDARMRVRQRKACGPRELVLRQRCLGRPPGGNERVDADGGPLRRDALLFAGRAAGHAGESSRPPAAPAHQCNREQQCPDCPAADGSNAPVCQPAGAALQPVRGGRWVDWRDCRQRR